MNILKILVLTLLLFSSSVFAVETLRVAVVFDGTTSYSLASRDTISNKILNDLNISFSLSGLSTKINFTRVYYSNLSFLNYNETLRQLKDRYLANPSNKVPKLNLHYVQKQNTADIVIGIVKPSNYLTENLCGLSLMIPTTASQIANGDGGIIFIRDNPNCLSDFRLVAHEVGHTFGLQHGEVVAIFNNDISHYNPSSILHAYAGGYGKSYFNGNYATIMAQRDMNISDDATHKHNRFSDKSKYICGALSNMPCGDYKASAVEVISAYAPYYNQRGAWYN